MASQRPYSVSTKVTGSGCAEKPIENMMFRNMQMCCIMPFWITPLSAGIKRITNYVLNRKLFKKEHKKSKTIIQNKSIYCVQCDDVSVLWMDRI